MGFSWILHFLCKCLCERFMKKSICIQLDKRSPLHLHADLFRDQTNTESWHIVTCFISVLLLWRADMFSFLCLLLFCINTEIRFEYPHPQCIPDHYIKLHSRSTELSQSSSFSTSLGLFPSISLCISLPSLSPFLSACLDLSYSLCTVGLSVQAGEELAVHWTLGHMARPGCEEGMLVWCFREVANCDSQGHFK